MINFEWIEYPLKAFIHRSNYLFLSSIIKGIEITKLFFHWHYDRLRELSLSYIIPCFEALLCSLFGATYTKIGTIQRRLAWPLRKDDTQNREAFHIFWQPEYWMIKVYNLYKVIIFNSKAISVILVPNQLYDTDAGSIPRVFIYKIIDFFRLYWNRSQDRIF